MTKRKAAGSANGPRKTSGKKQPRQKATKLSQMEAMLRKPEGATIEQLGEALGWQQHSVRGAIAGSLKRKGVSVETAQGESGPRRYRII